MGARRHTDITLASPQVSLSTLTKHIKHVHPRKRAAGNDVKNNVIKLVDNMLWCCFEFQHKHKVLNSKTFIPSSTLKLTGVTDAQWTLWGQC